MERRESRLALMARDADERSLRASDAARRDGPTDPSGRETGSGSGRSHHRRRSRGRRFAASTFSVASSSSSNVSNVERRAESPSREARAERGGARPLAVRARRAEVDARAREMERALARGDVERILHELFRGGSPGGSRYASPSSYIRTRDEPDERENEPAEVVDAVSPRTLSDAEADRASEDDVVFANGRDGASFDARGRATEAYGSDDDGVFASRPEGFSDFGSNEGDGSEGDFENDFSDLRVLRGSGSGPTRVNASWTSSLSLHRALEAMLTASRLDTMTYEELLDRFGPGDPGTPVAPAEAVRAIPTRRVTRRDLRGCTFKNDSKTAGETRADGDDAAGGDSTETSSETSSEMSSDSEDPLEPASRDFPSTSNGERCCVCLEAWAVGAETKTLRGCRHTFHAACIDRWLTEERNACPVCRRAGVDVRREAGELEGNDVAK